MAAIIHAHADYDSRYDNENFSGTLGNKGVANCYKVPIYVSTPGGYLKRYDPKTKKVVTLGKGLPPDPKSPTK